MAACLLCIIVEVRNREGKCYGYISSNILGWGGMGWGGVGWGRVGWGWVKSRIDVLGERDARRGWDVVDDCRLTKGWLPPEKGEN